MISSLLLLIIGSIFSTLLRLRSGTILAWYWSRKQPMIHKLVRYGVYAMILPILTIFCDFFSYIENETFSVLQLSSCPVNSIVTSRMSLESMLKVNYSREPTWPTWRNNDFHFCCSLENSFLSSIFEHLYQGVNGPISFWENVSKRYIIDEGETEFLLPFAFLSTLSHFNRYLHNAIKKVMFVPTKAKNTNPWESKCIGRLTSVRKLVTNYPKIYDLDQG